MIDVEELRRATDELREATDRLRDTGLRLSTLWAIREESLQQRLEHAEALLRELEHTLPRLQAVPQS